MPAGVELRRKWPSGDSFLPEGRCVFWTPAASGISTNSIHCPPIHPPIDRCVSVNLIQRFFRGLYPEGRPWLARRDWRERRITCQGGPRGLYFALAVGGFGFPSAFLAAIGISRILERDLDGIAYLSGAAVCSVVLVCIEYLWHRRRKFGDSICHLETLPGVIGGWFKATIEANLPVENAPSVTVRLVNFKMMGWRAVTTWETGQHAAAIRATHVHGDSYRIPVRFRIPDADKNYATWNWFTGGGWVLQVRAELPGIDFFAAFPVPIFKTAEAPPEEQRPEAILG